MNSPKCDPTQKQNGQEGEPVLVDKGPTVVPGKPLRPQRVDWWERALSLKLRSEYEQHLG